MAKDLPSGAGVVARDFDKVWEAFERLGGAASEAGPLNDRERRLVKLALSVAAGSEGAVHSHVRRALADGFEPAALRQVAVLAIPTLGLPQAVKALTWIDDLAVRKK